MRKICLILLLAAVNIATLFGQRGLSSELSRKMYYDVLILLNKYEYSLAMLEPSDAETFKDLFVNDSSPVYNDLLSVTTGKMLSVADYSRALLTEVTPGARVWLKNINHDEPVYESDSVWVIKVTFQKELLYYGDCEIKYSSNEYYLADYQLSMIIEWNASTRECRIRRIDGNIDSEYEPLPDGFVVLKISENPRNYDLLYYGAPLVYNIDSIVFLDKNALVDKNAFSYPIDDDIRLKVSADEFCKRKINVNYFARRWRIRPHYELAIVNGAYSITGDERIKFESNGYETGLDFGYYPLSGRKAKFGLFFGAGISVSNITASSLKSLDYRYKTNPNEDIDGDIYIRSYNISNFKYTVPIVDLVAPIYFDLDLRLSSGFSFYIDAGAKMYYNLKKDVSDFSATYTTSGLFTQYQNLELDANSINPYYDNAGNLVSFDGFVSNKELNVNNVQNKSTDIPSLWFDAFGGAGFRIRLAKSTSFFRDLYLDAGATYQYTLTPYSAAALKNLNYSKDTDIRDNVLVKYSDANINGGKENVNNISDYIREISRKGTIRAKVSLIYRF